MKKKVVGILLAAATMFCLMGCDEVPESVVIYDQNGEVFEQYDEVQNLFIDDGVVTFDFEGKEYNFVNFVVKTIGDVDLI